MADMDQLYTALRNADAAGDVDAARRLAAHIKTMQAQPAQPAMPQSLDDKFTAEAQQHMASTTAQRKTAAYTAGQGVGHDIAMSVPNALAGLVRGAGSIGATILAPYDMAKDAFAGKGLSLESNKQRRADIDGGLESLGADPSSIFYKGGKLGAEIAGTAGVGQALAIPARAVGASPGVVNALTTAGMRTGNAPTSAAERIADLALRSGAGSAVGGTSAAMIDPSQAKLGTMIGGATPLALMGAGKIGGIIDSAMSGPEIPDLLRNQIMLARANGYVIPPTQAKPTLVNRALEGLAGKLTTAQNASARNQSITNDLAKRAIGATDLTGASLADVRQRANAAYTQLGQSAPFVPDQQFAAALDSAGANSVAMRANFPGLTNNSVDDLVESLKGASQFEAQPTIEAIKRFRANSTLLKRSDDPAKVELGRTQAKLAGALEDLVDRNLQATGSTDLLNGYREARQTLAKTYDVEKALNPTTGNVDALKLAQLAKKGRPLSGDLATVADFASAFPKAARSVDSMGSLPGLSPLDFGAAGIASAAASNPMLLAAGFARPLARSAALSNVVQNRLLPSDAGVVQKLLRDLEQRQMLYRAAAPAAAD